MEYIFNRAHLKFNRNKAANTIGHYDYLIKNSSQDILDRVLSIFSSSNYSVPKEEPYDILELGSRHGVLTTKLIENFNTSEALKANIIATDISEALLKLNPASQKIVIDEENYVFPSSFNLIASVLNLHYINNVPGFLKNMLHSLKLKGLFIASFFGEFSLQNLKQEILKIELEQNLSVKNHIIPFISLYGITSLMQEIGFKDIVTDVARIKLQFQNAASLMHELKAMGESNIMINREPFAISRNSLNLLTSSTEPFSDFIDIITIKGHR